MTEHGGSLVDRVRAGEACAAHRARLAFAAIHVQRELESPALTGAGAIVAEGRAFRDDGGVENAPDLAMQADSSGRVSEAAARDGSIPAANSASFA